MEKLDNNQSNEKPKEKENWYIPYMDKKTKGIAAVDGCPLSCAKRTLNKYEFDVDEHIIVNKDLQITKNFNLNSSADIDKVADLIVEKVNNIYK